jgi:hypothetical protein
MTFVFVFQTLNLDANKQKYENKKRNTLRQKKKNKKEK